MTSDTTHLIHDVSDTALWVAVYRAMETERPDAIFRDPFAAKLTGERGRRIAQHMGKIPYISWVVVLRTYIIDSYIQKLIEEGVDTFVNLGAGLDTRPYRMKLPANLRWIEVDYPHMIEYKSKILANEKPTCQLERIPLDLADHSARQKLFTDIAQSSKKVAILTEGVIPYLTEEQVASLAKDLHAQSKFQFWIAEYFSPKTYKYLQTKRRKERMKNAPFQFFPANWFQFFENTGWVNREMRYQAIESEKLGRKQPHPWWAKFLLPLMPKERREEVKRFSGYGIFIPK